MDKAQSMRTPVQKKLAPKTLTFCTSTEHSTYSTNSSDRKMIFFSLLGEYVPMSSSVLLHAVQETRKTKTTEKMSVRSR